MKFICIYTLCRTPSKNRGNLYNIPKPYVQFTIQFFGPPKVVRSLCFIAYIKTVVLDIYRAKMWCQKKTRFDTYT